MIFFRRPSPQYRGYIDVIKDGRILGWAIDNARPKTRLQLEILAAGARIGIARADLYREDLSAAGIGDGRCAFSFDLPDVALETLAVKILGADYFSRAAKVSRKPTISRIGC